MCEHTKDKWILGYGQGVTGPNSPAVAGPTCHESLEYFNYKNKGGPKPTIKHTIISCGEETLAIIPLAHNREEQEANARLIATAPDLLAALENIIKPGCNCENCEQAKAAIERSRK